MSDAKHDSDHLQSLLVAPSPDDALASYLIDYSGLPGPRANLGLARRFADGVAAVDAGSGIWDLLRAWLAIPPTDAPTGSPREFLPMCALQALGGLYTGAGADRRGEILDHIRRAAGDDRWRIRESAAIALQRIGLRDVADLQQIVDIWLPTASLFEQRALLAALAEPPLLRAPGAAACGLALCESLLRSVQNLDRGARRQEGFRVLRQALEYGISVIVAASPEEGFALLRSWAAVDDPDIQRILTANLGKARLANAHGDRCREVEMASRRLRKAV